MPKINLSIPVEYIGEELEILVFPVNRMMDPPIRPIPVLGSLTEQIQMPDDLNGHWKPANTN